MADQTDAEFAAERERLQRDYGMPVDRYVGCLHEDRVVYDHQPCAEGRPRFLHGEPVVLCNEWFDAWPNGEYGYARCQRKPHTSGPHWHQKRYPEEPHPDWAVGGEVDASD